jgi:uncharacterized protein YkwD
MRIHPSIVARALALCGVLALLTNAPTARAQAPNAAADLAARINRERVARGLGPYALSARLTAAAQAHANDIARTTRYSHTGADGSTAQERSARAGYGKYSWGWRVGENWAHFHDVATAFAAWMDSEPHRNNLLHALYREFGVGVAATPAGAFVYVINFGAQPNVLPIFINDGAAETRAPEVTLTLSDEQVMPGGDGANVIGHPVQIEVSNRVDFAGAAWQPFASRVNWTLTPGGGTKSVYVKYRDARGRTTTASAAIMLNIPTTPTPRPTRTATRTPRPTTTPTSTKTPAPTETPTETPTEAPTTTPTLMPTLAPTTTATWTPIAAWSMSVIPAVGIDAITVIAPTALGAFGLVLALGLWAIIRRVRKD